MAMQLDGDGVGAIVAMPEADDRRHAEWLEHAPDLPRLEVESATEARAEGCGEQLLGIGAGAAAAKLQRKIEREERRATGLDCLAAPPPSYLDGGGVESVQLTPRC